MVVVVVREQINLIGQMVFKKSVGLENSAHSAGSLKLAAYKSVHESKVSQYVPDAVFGPRKKIILVKFNDSD